MRELSLFTGSGGGVLGSKILGWRTLGYVEKEKYCQEIIAQRIRDGIFDDAPIFTDIKLFVEQGFADAYRDCVDVVSAGFPCQPFSVAGKRKGADDERNLWPETMECIRRIRPIFAFLENVPGLLSSGYFGRILGDLAESGYDAEWTVLGADEVGANHRRKRLWILAYTRHGCSWGKKCGGNETNVGCHKGTTRPLGLLADHETRLARVKAHAAFDRLWQLKIRLHGCSKKVARSAGYRWLSKNLGIDKRKCHISSMDVELCRLVIDLCKNIGRN
jgi:site-specific DNA-cytosine methylase